MKHSRKHSSLQPTTALLNILRTLGKEFVEKQATSKNIWTLLLEKLAKFGLEGEIVFLGYEKHQPTCITLAAPNGTLHPSLGDKNSYQKVLKSGESLYQPKEALRGKKPAIYSPLADAEKTEGVLVISAKNLSPGDVPATEALCQHITLHWHILKNEGPSSKLTPPQTPASHHQEIIIADQAYHEIFKYSNEAVLVYEFDGSNIAANRQMAELTGYSESELSGMTLFDVIAPRYHTGCREKLAKLQRKEVVQIHKRHLVHKQGSEIPIELSDAVICSSNDKPLYIVGIARDITERVQGEKALKESEYRYRRLVDFSPMGVLVYIAEKIVYTNLTAARLLGAKQPNALLEKSILTFFSADAIQNIQQWLQQFQDTEKQKYVSKAKVIRQDGQEIFLDIYASHITYKSQKATQAVFSDITASVEAEENLKKTANDLERRAIQLQVAAEVARDATKEHSLQPLLNKAVDLIKDRFGFYHAGLFLISSDSKYAILTAATGEVGQKMLEQGHKLEVGEVGIVGYVAETGKARIVLDVGEDAVHFENPLLPETRSEMAVPLTVGDIVIGVLDVQSQQEAIFDEEDISVIEIIADQLAVAIQNVQLLEATQYHTSQLRGLYETTLATSSILDTEKILARFYVQADRLMSPDVFLIGLWDEDTQEIIIATAVEDGKEETNLIGRRFPLGKEGLLSWIIEHKKYLLIKNVDEDELPVKPLSHGKKVLSWLGVPLITRDRLVGVATVQSFEPDSFNDEDRRFLESMAAQVATALENARLFEAEALERKQAQVLREAARVISSLLSLDNVIEAILEQLAKVLSYDSGNIMLVEEDRLHVKGGRGYGKDTASSLRGSFSIERQHLKDILQKKKSVMLKNTKEVSSWTKAEFGNYVRSWLGIPILSRENVIGILSLDRLVSGGFTPKEIELAETFATHIAAAIENARLFEATEQRARELEAVHQASLSLTANLQPEEVFDSILKSVFKFMPGIKDAHIFLYDGTSLYFSAFLHKNGDREGPIAIPRQHGLTYKVAHTQEMIWVSDMKTHPLYDDVALEKGWEGGILGLPLLIGDRTVGVMNIAFQYAREFQQSELRVLKLLSDQAAIAIENARLFEQVAVEQRRISLLYDISQKLAMSLNVNTILEQAIGLITRSLGGDVGIAKLYNENTQALEDRAIYGRDINSSKVKNARQLKLGEGLIGWVAENQEAVYVPNVREDSHWIYIEGVDNPLGAIIVAPILSESTLLGVLSIQSDTVRSFSEEHLDLLNAISRQVGLALSNAQRYQDVNRLVERLGGEQHRQESLIEGLPVGVLLLGEDYRLKIINSLGKEFVEPLSFSAQVGDIITHIGPHSLSELIARSKEPLPVDIKIAGPPSRVFELQLRSITNDALQWVVALQDVTAEREAQERINMQDRLATVGKLAAGIGHDFNNIMAAILVYTELLLQEKNLPPMFEPRLNVIKQQIERASDLIRQMSDFSRSSVMEETQIDLLSFLKELEKLLSRTLPENIRITLRNKLGEYLVNVDPSRLQQIFMNLAVNSRDAMPTGGELSFDLTYFQCDEECDDSPFLSAGDWTKITVHDTGIGISEDALPHIFEPFFTTKEVGKGTGLGLAQVYGIIKQFDGHIEVESAEETGTTFTIFLPLVIASEGEYTEPQADITLDGTGQTVLLVEDNSPTRQALKAMLEMFGYQVTTASNGVEALNYLQTDDASFEFVVSDIVMPEMGGVELYHEIQAMWPDLKIIFVTGHPLHGQEKELLSQKTVSWLQKPFTIQNFSQIMEKLLKEDNA